MRFTTHKSLLVVPLTMALVFSLAAHAVEPDGNPLLVQSPLAFHFPAFDKIRSAHFMPAIEQGMRDQLAEVEAIADNPARPTFDNTIVAMERSGRLLKRATTTFYNLNATLTNPDMQKVQRTLAPLLSAHEDAIKLNASLYGRIAMLYAQRKELALDPESDRLLWRYYQDFARAGAKLSDADQGQLRALNSELATLQTAFAQNVLKERDANAVWFDARDDLTGLSATDVQIAAAAATKAGQDGKYLLALVNTSGQPALTYLQNHSSRLKVLAASLARGSQGGAYDNTAMVSAIAMKRAERAVLLGYPNHAAYQLAEQTIGSVDRLNTLLTQLAPAAVTNANKEAAEMQALVDAHRGGFKLDASDWQIYSEKVRTARYAFDEAQLKTYFELNHVLVDGVFFAAHQLYGLNFRERMDLPVYEPSVRVFDVSNEDGSPLAIFMFDPYARSNKNGGAWANAYVAQDGLNGDRPVVAIHINVEKPEAGQATLLSPEQVTTAFHEFGHALHGMFSAVSYPRFAGTSVPRDFVEYPSQVNEMWAFWPEVVQHYAKHYQTGEPLPQALLDKMQAAARFNQGFKTTEYLASSLLDQAWHQITAADVPPASGVLAFEATALKRYGVDFALVPPRYRSTYFSHSFSGGYSAGYYSYLWSEVLDADSVDWIKLHGGLTRANGERFRQTLLSHGGSADALQLFRDFTGGEPDLGPLLKRRGLEVVKLP